MSKSFKYTLTFPDAEMTVMAYVMVQQAYAGRKEVDVKNCAISVDELEEVVEDLHCMGVYYFHITAHPESVVVPTPPKGKHLVGKGDVVKFVVGQHVQTSPVYDVRRVGFWPRILQFLVAVDDEKYGHGLTWMEAEFCHPVSEDAIEA